MEPRPGRLAVTGRPGAAELVQGRDQPADIVRLAAEPEARPDRPGRHAEPGQQRVRAEPAVPHPDPMLGGQVRGHECGRIAVKGERHHRHPVLGIRPDPVHPRTDAGQPVQQRSEQRGLVPASCRAAPSVHDVAPMVTRLTAPPLAR